MKKKTMTLEQQRLLREVQTLLKTPKPKNEPAATAPVRLTQQVNDFLHAHYDFRYNLLTEETEFRPAGRRDVAFRPVDKRDLNTFCLEAHAQGIACWDKDLSRYIHSTYIPGYHPFRLYMEELPAWDGIDRLTELARRVSRHPLWVRSFHTWMLALAAQWMGQAGLHANSVAPILISEEQGRQKSTFCKALMPEVLRRYYSDNVKLTAQGNPERLLAEMGLLNMDEFDKYPAARMPLLKSLMQMSDLNLCKAYQKNFRNLPRIASFIGTSNRKDLLCDPTGSRRFICIEVERVINCDGICHEQVFAQLKAELSGGARPWFTKEEERELQRHNDAYYRGTPAEDVLLSCYRPAVMAEAGAEWLSAAHIYKVLRKFNSAAMRGTDPQNFGRMLVAWGIRRKHTKMGNVYWVKQVGE